MSPLLSSAEPEVRASGHSVIRKEHGGSNGLLPTLLFTNSTTLGQFMKCLPLGVVVGGSAEEMTGI